MEIKYDIRSELGASLEPGSTYTYQFLGRFLEEPDITAENLLLKQQALKCVSQMSDRVTGIMMLLNMYLNTIL